MRRSAISDPSQLEDSKAQRLKDSKARRLKGAKTQRKQDLARRGIRRPSWRLAACAKRIRHQINKPRSAATIIADRIGRTTETKAETPEITSSTTLATGFPIPPVPAVIMGRACASHHKEAADHCGHEADLAYYKV
jgi:hypothetical protein